MGLVFQALLYKAIQQAYRPTCNQSYFLSCNPNFEHNLMFTDDVDVVKFQKLKSDLCFG